MRNIILKLEYDGTKYCGWQKQNNAKTIQGTLEEALGKLTKEEIEVIGCSRTDSGVHALEYVCNFNTNSSIPAEKFKYAVNHMLPDDIVVIESKETVLDFHSRYNSTGKTYIYKICNRDVRNAINRNYVYHYRGKLDFNLMVEASKYFIGKHDFAAFRNLGSSVKTTTRTITELELTKENEDVVVKVTGDGFLYNMVRIIVGTLIDVGTEKIKPKEIIDILESKDRKRSGPSAPANGLHLFKVYYK